MLDQEGIPEALDFSMVGRGWQEVIGVSVSQTAVFGPRIGCTSILFGRSILLLHILALRPVAWQTDGSQSGRGTREKRPAVTALQAGK